MKAWIGRLALVAIGLVFLIAGGLKALDPASFVDQIGRFRILPASLAPFAAYTLVPFEVALGAALLVDYRRRWAVGAAVALLLGFIGLMAYTWAIGGDVSECGCFGSFVERSPGETVVEDLVFLAVALIGLMAPPRRQAGGAARGSIVAAAAATTLVLMPLAPSLPFDALVTRLKPGVRLEDLKLSLPGEELGRGRHLVALLALAEESSGSAVEGLNALAARPGAPGIAVIYADEDDVKDAFFWTHGPTFPMYKVVREEMRGLYRRLPRFFLLENGVVTRVWEVLPPAETLAAPAAGAV